MGRSSAKPKWVLPFMLVLGSLASQISAVDDRDMAQTFPANVVKLWNEWDVRVLVLTSLCLQIVLIVFGNRRKYIAGIWIRIVTWMAYLSADWVAAVALGMISNFQGDDDQQNPQHPNNLIMASWAPFLLVHLGGPDTITSYSMEDNELWLRHLLGLIVQVGVALYILIRTATTTRHVLLVVPVFVAGIVKYGERTWVLRSASNEKLSDSLLPPPNSGKGYAIIAEKYSAIKARGEGVAFSSTLTEGIYTVHVDPVITEAKPLQEAHELFQIFRRLYANLILDYNQRGVCYNMIRGHSAEEVFKQIEIELGFMSDVLHTKAIVVHSLTGVIFRSFSLLCYISTAVVFCFVIDKQLYSTIDISLTYLLSFGAIGLELYAIMILVSTDWSLLWLSKQRHRLAYPIYRAISSARSNYLSNGKRWSESMAQFNLIDFCLKEKPPKCAGIQRFLGIYQMAEGYWYTTYKDVPIEMKQLIFKQLKDAIVEVENQVMILKWRGNHAVENKGCMDYFSWSLVEPFDKSILLWHIATDLCFYSDLDGYDQQACPNSESKHMISKLLSDYMMYLLVMRHLMLPMGIGQIRFRDTCAEATTFFEKKRNVITKGRSHARQALLAVNTELCPASIIGDRSKTVLFEGCILAKQLKSLETDRRWSNTDKWEMISQVWIEMLCYAAGRCEWKEHGQQLRRGGELLTHVCLLMANLGVSKQFQIRRGSSTFSIEAVPRSAPN